MTQHTPGQDTTCATCGAQMVWVENKFPDLSFWHCPLHRAAPDLLAALELIVYSTELSEEEAQASTNPHAMIVHPRSRLIENARAAIAKARSQ